MHPSTIPLSNAYIWERENRKSGRKKTRFEGPELKYIIDPPAPEPPLDITVREYGILYFAFLLFVIRSGQARLHTQQTYWAEIVSRKHDKPFENRWKAYKLFSIPCPPWGIPVWGSPGGNVRKPFSLWKRFYRNMYENHFHPFIRHSIRVFSPGREVYVLRSEE